MDEPSSAHNPATVERYRQMARNPLLPRSQVQGLLAEFDRLLEVSAPPAGFPALGTTATSRAAADAKHGLQLGLDERAAGDRAEPRREELSDRVLAALTALTACIDGMQTLERAKIDAEAGATADGFVVQEDWCIALGPGQVRTDELQKARARHEHCVMSALAGMEQLQYRTVHTIRDQLGVDEGGIPWTLMECARAGLDLGGSFEASARLPDSPLRDLMEQLADDMRQANAVVRGER
ncbi:hypothetical protein M1247_10435 [Mycobacterium sp. 21AC1]|uniref:hypothetical protein n=1 Tax=[Mycobacterium] appelbergii TaxID=2939269 RepID=UPI0029390BA2|nr:hypothetical protein [Mycobacterium sp. 21AC1]MDV3125329.1 hypothetical protein [Mycobacterium sp. 21AC1]